MPAQDGSLWYMSDYVSDNCSLANVSDLSSSLNSCPRGGGVGRATSVVETTCYPVPVMRPAPHYHLPCSSCTSVES